ncbi:MAG: metal-dependent hydrolase [Bacteroidota bacterium]|nr:metal-dependent hydrolase [Bacteroidota bacterium]
MKVKYFGHSCFAVNISGKHLLFDPFISPNELCKDININEIEADYIFVSHAHFDHLADLLQIAINTDAKIVAIWEICEWVNKQGYTNTHAMNIGGGWNFEFGNIQMVRAVHSSSFPDGSYGGQAAGFVVKSNENCFYYSGDTALSYDMKLIPERHKLDVAFLPIGNNFTMDIQDAIKASEFIQCDHIIGMHYDTFGFIVIDHDAAINQFNQYGKTLTLLNISQEIEL